MTLKLNGTNSVAAPAYAGDDADTGLQCGTNELKLVTGGTARATVDSDGDLGIGTTSPSALLHIAKSGGNAKLLIQRSNTAANTNDYGSILWQSSAGNNNALIGAARHSAENDAYMFFSTASGGSLQEELRIQSAGGISFNGDTAQANALDDYEEGTWTPTCESDGNIGSSQYTNTYTKIGRLVTINCDIHALDNITSTNPIKIGGLPFVPSATSGELGSAAAHGERYGSTLIVAFLAHMSSQWVIRFRKGVGSSSYDDVDHSDINNAGDNNLRFSLTYEITT